MQAKQMMSYSNCQLMNWDPNLALTLMFIAVRHVSLSCQCLESEQVCLGRKTAWVTSVVFCISISKKSALGMEPEM